MGWQPKRGSVPRLPYYGTLLDGVLKGRRPFLLMMGFIPVNRFCRAAPTTLTVLQHCASRARLRCSKWGREPSFEVLRAAGSGGYSDANRCAARSWRYGTAGLFGIGLDDPRPDPDRFGCWPTTTAIG